MYFGAARQPEGCHTRRGRNEVSRGVTLRACIAKPYLGCGSAYRPWPWPPPDARAPPEWAPLPPPPPPDDRGADGAARGAPPAAPPRAGAPPDTRAPELTRAAPLPVLAVWRVRHDPAAPGRAAPLHELVACGCARGDCMGDCARTGAAVVDGRTVVTVRGATTTRALTARTGRPVAAVTCATGGPNEPPRAGAPRGAASGVARWTMMLVRCTETAWTEIGCVKCSARTATQPGCE